MADKVVLEYVNKIAPLIVAEGKRRGYRVFSTVIAQAIVESRYGLSDLARIYNNHFGLKAGAAWVIKGNPSAVMKTKEEYKPGTLTTIKDAFRVYPDMASGVKGYYDFISTKRYENLKSAITYRQYAEMLKADGYATASHYVDTLCDRVAKYGLYVYDTGGSLQMPVEWEIGMTYTTQQDLNVRFEPDGDKKPFECLTENAKAHSIIGTSGEGILRRGTNVTIYDIQTIGNTVWLKIPSGWICGKNSRNIYVL